MNHKITADAKVRLPAVRRVVVEDRSTWRHRRHVCALGGVLLVRALLVRIQQFFICVLQFGQLGNCGRELGINVRPRAAWQTPIVRYSYEGGTLCAIYSPSGTLSRQKLPPPRRHSMPQGRSAVETNLGDR